MQVGIYELPKGYLSASSIDTLLKCPRMFEFRYIENRKGPQNKMLALGSITHKAFETYYSDVIENGDKEERLTGSQMVEMTMDVVIPNWFEKEEVELPQEDHAEIETVVPNIVENYVDQVGVHINPLATEKEVDFVMENQVPVKAYLDLVRDLGDDQQGLVDYKISGKAWQMSRLTNSLQFMLYTYITGIPNVQIQNIVKPGKGKKVIISSKYEELDHAGRNADSYDFKVGSSLNIFGHRFPNQKHYLEDLVQRCAELITTGVFVPTQPGNWWCSPVYCDYWDLCRGKKI